MNNDDLSLIKQLESEQNYEELKKIVHSRHWWHSINVGHGIITPGIEDCQEKLKHMAIPNSFNGLSVIDIGTYEGFYAFLAEEREASSVLATDSFVWEANPETYRNFQIASQLRNSKVESKFIRVEDLSPESVGIFDVVLFLGVLYHAPNPYLYLEKVKSITKSYVIIESHVDCLDIDYPVAAYYPNNSLNGDPTNFWGFNQLALEGILKDVGFSRIVFKSKFYPNYINTGHKNNQIKTARVVYYAYV